MVTGVNSARNSAFIRPKGMGPFLDGFGQGFVYGMQHAGEPGVALLIEHFTRSRGHLDAVERYAIAYNSELEDFRKIKTHTRKNCQVEKLHVGTGFVAGYLEGIVEGTSRSDYLELFVMHKAREIFHTLFENKRRKNSAKSSPCATIAIASSALPRPPSARPDATSAKEGIR